MKATLSEMPSSSKIFPPIFWGGLISGILDITSAFIIYALRGLSPIQLLQLVASGLLGADAYKGGLPVAFLGLCLHFLIAFTAAAVYHMASRRLQILVQHPVLCGLFYGVAVYLFMNSIVLPLSAFPTKIVYTPVVLIRGLLIHMFCIGLPISLANKRFSK